MVTEWNQAGFEIEDNTGRRKIYNPSKRKSCIFEMHFWKGNFVYQKVNGILNSIGYELNCNSIFASILKYESGDFLYRHHDRDGDRFVCISVQLSESDDYTGGNFIYYLNNESILASREMGNTIMFNPDLNHEVSTLLNGERQCLIVWITLHDLKQIKKSSII